MLTIGPKIKELINDTFFQPEKVPNPCMRTVLKSRHIYFVYFIFPFEEIFK